MSTAKLYRFVSVIYQDKLNESIGQDNMRRTQYESGQYYF